MNTLNEDSDDYRAGYPVGYTDRQAEIDELNDLANRFYRQADNDERRIPGDFITRAEIEQHRQLDETPLEVTRAGALASWGLTDDAESGTDEGSRAEPAVVDDVPPAKNTNRAGKNAL